MIKLNVSPNESMTAIFDLFSINCKLWNEYKFTNEFAPCLWNVNLVM